MRKSALSAHYVQPGMHERILDTLVRQGKDIEHLTVADLAPADNFHSRGKAATEELLATVGFRAGGAILDVGSGLGGPARYLASQGFRVTGVDLTPEFCEIAEDLTRRAGLSEWAAFVAGSALELPFPKGAFDGAWLQHVSVNVADKATLMAEIHRVLRPGGKLAVHEICSGAGGEPILPAPWATSPADSHLVSQTEFRQVLLEAGFVIDSWEDDTALSLDSLTKLVGAGEEAHPARLNQIVVFGEERLERFGNLAESFRQGRATVVQAVASKPD